MSRIRAESIASDNAPPPRPCDRPGCGAHGEFRAPRSRDTLDCFYWFCLNHVREYNAAWNYYAGMSAREIEADIRNDTVWQRPTWPLGSRIGSSYGLRFRAFGLFDEDDDDASQQRRTRQNKRPLSQEEQALAIFDLEPPFTLGGLKTRYKQLVKLHHPDTHGGDKAAEERLKIINQAYSTLKASYFS
jgi:curved DNA-binding protein CbpA